MALSVREFLASKLITGLEYPPYSRNLAPNEFFLFPKIKKIFKGRHFDDTSSEGHLTQPVPKLF
jgi:hypothetical protein